MYWTLGCAGAKLFAGLVCADQTASNAEQNSRVGAAAADRAELDGEESICRYRGGVPCEVAPRSRPELQPHSSGFDPKLLPSIGKASADSRHQHSQGNTAVMTRALGSTLKAAIFLVAPLGVLVGLAATAMARSGDDGHGNGSGAHHRWYVSPSAPAAGDGSAAAPFNSLALVQAASGPGDTIVVVPSPLSVAPLDGGIVLQP